MPSPSLGSRQFLPALPPSALVVVDIENVVLVCKAGVCVVGTYIFIHSLTAEDDIWVIQTQFRMGRLGGGGHSMPIFQASVCDTHTHTSWCTESRVKACLYVSIGIFKAFATTRRILSNSTIGFEPPPVARPPSKTKKAKKGHRRGSEVRVHIFPFRGTPVASGGYRGRIDCRIFREKANYVLRSSTWVDHATFNLDRYFGGVWSHASHFLQA